MLNDLATVKSCIANGANVSAADFNKRSPLWIACYKGNTDVVRCLIEGGAELGGGDVVSTSHCCLYVFIVVYS